MNSLFASLQQKRKAILEGLRRIFFSIRLLIITTDFFSGEKNLLDAFINELEPYPELSRPVWYNSFV